MAEKFRLVGFDTFEGKYYPLGGNYESEEEAQKVASDRLEKIEKNQPSSSSGGQGGIGSVQDRVFIEGPSGTRYRASIIPQKK